MFKKLNNTKSFYFNVIVRFLITSKTFDVNANIFNIYKIVNSHIS